MRKLCESIIHLFTYLCSFHNLKHIFPNGTLPVLDKLMICIFNFKLSIVKLSIYIFCCPLQLHTLMISKHHYLKISYIFFQVCLKKKNKQQNKVIKHLNLDLGVREVKVDTRYNTLIKLNFIVVTAVAQNQGLVAGKCIFVL